MDDHELTRLDYEQTTQLVRALTDVRFKLLAFVPTITGAAVAFLRDPGSAGELLSVGLLGFAATLGVFVYELRNSQVHDAAVERAAVLEERLGIRSVADPSLARGVFGERPPRTLALFGRLVVRQDRGLALVYAAAFAGWGYLVAWGALALAGVPEPRGTGAALGAALGLLVVVTTTRLAGGRGEPAAG